MDLLRNLFGSLTSGIIRLAVAAGVLGLCYLFIVKPVLKTTDDVVHQTGFDRIAKSIEGVDRQVQREVRRTFEMATQHGANPQKLVHCVRGASGDVKKIERCTRRF